MYYGRFSLLLYEMSPNHSPEFIDNFSPFEILFDNYVQAQTVMLPPPYFELVRFLPPKCRFMYVCLTHYSTEEIFSLFIFFTLNMPQGIFWSVVVSFMVVFH